MGGYTGLPEAWNSEDEQTAEWVDKAFGYVATESYEAALSEEVTVTARFLT